MQNKYYYVVVLVGYIYLAISAIIFYFMGFFKNNPVFDIELPIYLLSYEISEWWEVIIFCGFFFIQQAINTTIGNIVYPYIINEIQDRKSLEPPLGKIGSLTIAATFNLYSMLDAFLLVVGAYSNIIFMASYITSGIITSTIINYYHLKQSI